MNNKPDDRTNDILDQAFRALRNTPMVEVPPSELLASTRETVNQVARESATLNTRQRRLTMARISQMTVAAVLVLGLMGLVMWSMPGNVGTSIAFADVVEAVTRSRTARYIVEPAHRPSFKLTVMVLDSGRIRMEATDDDQTIAVLDAIQGKALVLNTQGKKASVLTFEDAAEFRTFGSYLSDLQSLRSDDVKIIGKKAIDGLITIGFRVQRGVLSEEYGMPHHWTVWVNPETNLPVQIELANEKDGDTVMTLSDFQFDVEFDKALFDLTPPEDYEITDKTGNGS